MDKDELRKQIMNKKKLEELRKAGNTFCPLAFVHYHVDTDKTAKICCHATEPFRDELLDFNHGVYKTVRDKMLKGEKLRYCTHCYNSEDKGVVSLRQRAFDDVKYSKGEDFLFEQIENHKEGKPVEAGWYDLRISNNCNLACRMCSPKYSSQLARITNSEDPILSHEADVDISDRAFKIQLLGGEPFMIKKLAKQLASVENRDCVISVNTNATIVTKPLLEQLKRFNQVHMVASIDAYGDLNEYIRRGSKWELIDKNLDLFMDEGFNVLVNTVVQKDNVNHLKPLGDYLIGKGINDWLLNELFEPSDMRWELEPNIDIEQLEALLSMRGVYRNESSKTLVEHIINARR